MTGAGWERGRSQKEKKNTAAPWVVTAGQQHGRSGVSPVVTLVDVDGASPGACAAPGSLPGPGQGRGWPACLRYSGHCLHTMYGWLQGSTRAHGVRRSSELCPGTRGGRHQRPQPR